MPAVWTWSHGGDEPRRSFAEVAYRSTTVGSAFTSNGQPSITPTTFRLPFTFSGTLHESEQVKPQP